MANPITPCPPLNAPQTHLPTFSLGYIGYSLDDSVFLRAGCFPAEVESLIERGHDSARLAVPAETHSAPASMLESAGALKKMAKCWS